MVALRNQALRALPEYQPGLGGLFVVGRYCDQGIGTALVRAGMKLAQKQGYARVYAAALILLKLFCHPCTRAGLIFVTVVSLCRCAF